MALRKKEILARSRWDWLTQTVYTSWCGRTAPHGPMEFSEEEIKDGFRKAFRNSGRFRNHDYGCGRSCILCNPELRFDMPVATYRIMERMKGELQDWLADEGMLSESFADNQQEIVCPHSSCWTHSSED